jgi:serine/threonine protein kinase
MAIRIERQAEPIPGYRLLERLGGGGFGEVWKVEAPGGLLKAIKFVHGNLLAVGDEVVRAKQELKALNRVKTVRHPYILSLERFDIIDGQLLIVMELADRNLWDRFQECRGQGQLGIPRDELLGYMAETAEALDLMNLHYQLQHLDIKPQNLFLVFNHIKVADFGLVKDLEGVRAQVTGGVTPVYAAPETFDGEVSRFCDQYSLAIVYEELLTGQRPFKGASVQQLIMQHLTARPNLLPLPVSDREPIARALAKKPEERFPSCAALVEDLRSSTGRVVKGEKPAPADRSASRMDVSTRLTAEGRGLAQPSARPTSAREKNTGIMPRPVIADPVAKPGSRVEIELPPLPETPAVPPRPEITGDGLLFPALVIGLGNLGLSVLRLLRQSLCERVGALDQLPNVRFLYLDTDPEAGHAATHGTWGHPLDGNEILLARLNRASHYLKPTAGRPRTDTWFDSKMLYRIPRNLVTTGLRGLGRLAFVDNYRAIAQKVRADLEAVTGDWWRVANETSSPATQHPPPVTTLGMRTNRPRVYVVTSLMGGTGSGMFIDLAYVVRALLRQLGYPYGEVVGLFLVPEVDQDAVRTMALGNAFAALTELNHFASPQVTFSARYDDKDSALRDTAPPFGRLVLLPLPKEGTDPTPTRKLAALAGDFLCRELITPLGQAADSAGLSCQSFGLYRYSWPRGTLIRCTARRLCQQLVQVWMARESIALRGSVQAWVEEQWAKAELGPEFLIERLQKACERQLVGAGSGECGVRSAECGASGTPHSALHSPHSPEAAFEAVVAPVEKASRPTASLWGRRIPDLDPALVIEALDRLEQLVGRPDGNVVTRRPALLADALPAATEALVTHCEKHLAHLAVRLIEQPEFRLAGAEEAIRLVTAKIEQQVQHYEVLSQELSDKAGHAFARIYALLENLQATGGKRPAAEAVELVEMLRAFPKCHYQSLVLRHVLTSYTTLRNHLADQMREVEFCRTRLGDLLHAFTESAEGSRAENLSVPGRHLLPDGCRSLDEAIEQTLARMTANDLQSLDEKVQAMIQQQFTALVHVCMTSGNLLRSLEGAMLHEAEPFAKQRLRETNLVAMYLESYPREEEALRDLASAFAAAAPRLAGRGRSVSGEVQILAVPPAPDEQHLRELARKALPDAQLAPAASADDIVFYREVAGLALTDLEQLGPAGQQAYRQMTTSETFTPHSRTDQEWCALSAE